MKFIKGQHVTYDPKLSGDQIFAIVEQDCPDSSDIVRISYLPDGGGEYTVADVFTARVSERSANQVPVRYLPRRYTADEQMAAVTANSPDLRDAYERSDPKHPDYLDELLDRADQ